MAGFQQWTGQRKARPGVGRKTPRWRAERRAMTRVRSDLPDKARLMREPHYLKRESENAAITAKGADALPRLHQKDGPHSMSATRMMA